MRLPENTLSRLVLLSVLVVGGLGSAWLLHRLETGQVAPLRAEAYEPDMYMSQPDILTVDETGSLARRLQAEHLSRYPEEGTVELVQPRIALLRGPRRPLRVRANQGWLVSGDKVAFLQGDVRLEQAAAGAGSALFASTERVGVLLDAGYAETNAEVQLYKGRIHLRAIGMVAHLEQGRLEFAQHQQTRIRPAQQ